MPHLSSLLLVFFLLSFDLMGSYSLVNVSRDTIAKSVLFISAMAMIFHDLRQLILIFQIDFVRNM